MKINLNCFKYYSDDYNVSYVSSSLDMLLKQFNTTNDNGRVLFNDVEFGYISNGKFEEYEYKF